MTFAYTRPHVLVLLAALVLYRLLLPVWVGQFGPDEARLVGLVQRILSGEATPLVGQEGSRGLPYGPVPALYFAIAYGLTGFNLAAVALATSFLSVLAAALLAASVRSRRHAIWILLLSLTSPLAIYFSTMPFWETPLMIPLAAATLWLARSSPLSGWLREFAVGLTLGLSLAVHPLAIPFVAGVVVWRGLIVHRVLRVVALAGGIMVATLPYVVGLVLTRDRLAPTFTSGGRELSPASPLGVIESLFRFWGAPATLRLTPPGPLRSIEDGLAVSSAVIIGVASLAWVVVVWRRRARMRLDSLMTLAALCALAYLPFGYITGADRADLGQSLWWLAPVVLTGCASALLGPRRAAYLLGALVIWNMLATGVQYVVRVAHGTTAEPTAEAGQGPSWWMQLQTARDVCAAVAAAIDSGAHPPVVVEAPCKFCDSGLPSLAALKSPSCGGDARFVSSSEAPVRIRVEADQAHTFLVWSWLRDATTEAYAPPGGLVLRLVAESLRNLAPGTPIERWTDSSESGNDAVQPDGVRQPTYDPHGPDDIPGVRFDGIDDVLTTPPVVLAQDHTIVIVGAAARTQDRTTDIFWSYAADERASTLVEIGIYHDHGTSRTLRSRYEGIDTYNGRASRLLEKPFVLAQRRAAGRVTTIVNGVEQLSHEDLTIDFTAPRRFRIGLHSDAGQYLDGWLDELRIYNVAMPDRDMAELTTELASAYGIGRSD